MKQESLVIADQNAAVNTFPGLVHTARHTMGVDCTRSGQLTRKGSVHHGVVDDWGEVVTRQPQGNLRLDHLLIDSIRSARIHNKLFFSLSLRFNKRIRVCSSAGQSTVLITRGSVVRVHLDPPFYNGAIAQLVERLPCTQEVNGSTPFGSTTTYG